MLRRVSSLPLSRPVQLHSSNKRAPRTTTVGRWQDGVSVTLKNGDMVFADKTKANVYTNIQPFIDNTMKIYNKAMEQVEGAITMDDGETKSGFAITGSSPSGAASASGAASSVSAAASSASAAASSAATSATAAAAKPSGSDAPDSAAGRMAVGGWIVAGAAAAVAAVVVA